MKNNMLLSNSMKKRLTYLFLLFFTVVSIMSVYTESCPLCQMGNSETCSMQTRPQQKKMTQIEESGCCSYSLSQDTSNDCGFCSDINVSNNTQKELKTIHYSQINLDLVPRTFHTLIKLPKITGLLKAVINIKDPPPSLSKILLKPIRLLC